jgi:transcription antitermination factor NusG
MADNIRWFVAQAPYMTESIRENVQNLGYETFVPILKATDDDENKAVKRKTSKMLTFNYVFIRGERRQIEDSLRNISRIHLLYHRPGVAPGKSYGNYERKPMVVTDREMEMFRRTVSLYQNGGAPMVDVDERELQSGDLVRITGGLFAGVEGILKTKKGKEGGKVIVSISHLVSVSTVNIEPQYIQVIKFSSENKHIYRKLDTMLAKAKLLMAKRANGEELTETEQLDMQQFINNYSMAETETQNMDAKLKTLTFMAYVVLGIYDYANNAYRQLVNDVLPRMKSVRIKSLIEEQMQLYQKIIRNAPE